MLKRTLKWTMRMIEIETHSKIQTLIGFVPRNIITFHANHKGPPHLNEGLIKF